MCTSPITGFRTASGRLTMKDTGGLNEMTVPCGGCQECRIRKARDWTLRAVCEAQMHSSNAFVTLTYSPEKMPVDGSLDLKHMQDFHKRLRKAIGAPLKTLYCGEYGPKLQRPHYHAIYFGLEFSDQEVWGHNKYGHAMFRSAELERLWPHGFSSIGPVTSETAGYVARYTLKKMTGTASEDHYKGKTPEFAQMSRRPGIGHSWFLKYWQDCYPKDFVTIDGKKFPVPRYYDKLLELAGWFSDSAVEAREKTEDKRREFQAGREPATEWDFAVREYVQHQKSMQLKREYEHAYDDDLRDQRHKSRRLHDAVLLAEHCGGGTPIRGPSQSGRTRDKSAPRRLPAVQAG